MLLCKPRCTFSAPSLELGTQNGFRMIKTTCALPSLTCEHLHTHSGMCWAGASRSPFHKSSSLPASSDGKRSLSRQQARWSQRSLSLHKVHKRSQRRWRDTAQSRSPGDTKDSSVINSNFNNQKLPTERPSGTVHLGCMTGFHGFFQHSSQFKEEPFINDAPVHCRSRISQRIQGFASQLHKSTCWKSCLKKKRKKKMQLNVVSATQPCKQEFLTSCTLRAFYSPYYRGTVLCSLKIVFKNAQWD